MVPELQIEIFVTPPPPSPPPTTVYDTGSTFASTAPIPQLILPHEEGQNPSNPTLARFGDHSQLDSLESLGHVDGAVRSDIDLSHNAGEHERNQGHEAREWQPMDLYTDHETHILDYTNFDGDVDAALPGEEAINRTVKKQGKIRRALTRKATLEAAADAKGRPQERLADTDNGRSSAHLRLPDARNRSRGRDSRPRSRDSHTPTRDGRSLSRESLPLSRDSRSHSRDSRSGGHAHTISADNYLSTDTLLSNASHVLAGLSSRDSRTDTASTYEPPILTGAGGEEVRLEIEEQEMQDLIEVSEYARLRKAKPAEVAEMVAEEVNNSKGSMVVACCGPESLCAMMRKIIAAKIDPARMRRENGRGSITLISEEFKY